MSAELKCRVKAFLQRKVPKTVNYVPGSIAENFLTAYAWHGRLADDAETSELLELARMESSSIVEQLKSAEAAAYFHESAALLAAIEAERGTNPSQT